MTQAKGSRPTRPVELDEVALAAAVDEFLAGRGLTAKERQEVAVIARGVRARRSAEVQGVSLQTIRTRRKRLYERLEVEGALQLQSALLGHLLQRLAP